MATRKQAKSKNKINIKKIAGPRRTRLVVFIGIFGILGVLFLALTSAARPTRGISITGVVATVAGPHQVNIKWDGPARTDGSYKYVSKQTCPDGSYFNGVSYVTNETVHAGQHFYVPESRVPASTTCNVKVELYDTTGRKGNKLIGSSQSISFTTPAESSDKTAPTAPAGLTGSMVYPQFAKLTWNPSTDDIGVTGYDVHAGFSPDNVSFSSNSAYMIVYPQSNQMFSVRARDANGNVSAWSTSIVVNNP